MHRVNIKCLTLSFICSLGEKEMQCESSFGEVPGDSGKESAWRPAEGTKFQGRPSWVHKMYPPLTAANVLGRLRANRRKYGGFQSD